VYDPTPNTREGFSARVSRDLGPGSAIGNSALMETATLQDIVDNPGSAGWEAEMAYGTSRGNGMVGSPYMKANGNEDQETARVGYRMEPDIGQNLNASLDVWAGPGTRSSIEPPTGPKYGLALSSRW
ncbi:MAG: hypothetical protein OXF46_02310, partial [Rhodobacteraceae bacterium]|nr:hypothetical protein [Paracoccaceae bacterium]